jgi:hypothetical protein
VLVSNISVTVDLIVRSGTNTAQTAVKRLKMVLVIFFPFFLFVHRCSAAHDSESPCDSSMCFLGLQYLRSSLKLVLQASDEGGIGLTCKLHVRAM